MQLTDFCKNDGFESVLALTYNINVHFFEKVIFRNLIIGNAYDILILADGQQAEQDIARDIDELRHLGRDYLLHPIYLKGAFHPKLILRLNEKSARLCFGSGNLSFGGWGGNQEVAATWEFNERSAWQLNSMLDVISNYITDDFALERFQQLRDQSWLLTKSKPEDILYGTRIIVTPKDQSLSMLLAERWEGRRFESLHILTGSTDENGAFIQWCHDKFGIKNSIVGVNPEFCSFNVRQLQKIPVSIKIAPFESSRRLHAKFYLFDGPDGSAVIMGSANCSRAAWMLEPVKGGNVESIIIYDDIDKSKVMNILDIFPDEHKYPEEVLTRKIVNDSRDFYSGVGYYLTHLSIDERSETLTARFSKVLNEKYKIECEIIDSSFYLKPINDKNTEWIVKIPTLTPSKEILWVKVTVTDTNGNKIVFRRWIDYPDQLRRSAIVIKTRNALHNLSQAKSTSEQRKILEDLHYLGDMFIHRTSSFPDFRHSNERERKKDGTTVPQVTPEMLIRSLNEKDKKLTLRHHHSFMEGSPLTGIMRALFTSLDDEESLEELALVDENQFPTDVEVEDTKKRKGNGSETELSEDEIKKCEERFKTKLGKEFSSYLDKLASEKFAIECTARQMVEACAFMLAVAAKCIKRNSEYEELAREWIIRVVEILFMQKYKEDQSVGLFDYVKKRYSEHDFNCIVGDGSLWVVFLVILGIVPWNDVLGNLKRAFILRLIYKRPEMIMHLNEDKFNLIISKIDFKNVEVWFSQSIPDILKSLDKIEYYLDNHFEMLVKDHDPSEYMGGDWFYRKDIGLAVFENFTKNPIYMSVFLPYKGKMTKVCSKNYYVNIRIAMSKDINLKKMYVNLGKKFDFK